MELDAVTSDPTGPPVIAASFEDFYIARYRDAMRLAILLVHDRGHAAEIVQEAFGSAFVRWEHVSRYDRVDLWLRRLIVNRAISRRRRLISEVRAMARLGHRPVDVVVDQSESVGVWVHVRSLPKRQAEALVLVYGCDLSVDEAAQAMRCSAGSVKTHLSRGRAALTAILEGTS